MDELVAWKNYCWLSRLLFGSMGKAHQVDGHLSYLWFSGPAGLLDRGSFAAYFNTLLASFHRSVKTL